MFDVVGWRRWSQVNFDDETIHGRTTTATNIMYSSRHRKNAMHKSRRDDEYNRYRYGTLLWSSAASKITEVGVDRFIFLVYTSTQQKTTCQVDIIPMKAMDLH
jgi:hypothetical protein